MKYLPWILIVIVLASCQPAVPYNQMPGGPDLYSNAQNNRELAAEALRQAELAEAALTATAQAPIIHITETAAAMQIQAAQAAGTGTAAIQTQVGAMTATAVWWTPTPNFDGTQTAAAISAQSTSIANQAIRDQLQLQREIQNNEWNRLVGPLALIFVAVLILFLMMQYQRRQRYQAAPVDARGNVLPVLDLVEGSFTDIDRSPNFKGSMTNDLLIRLLAYMFEKKFGVPPMLPEVTAARQDATTERDQMIDLATRGLPVTSSDSKEMKRIAGQQMVNQMSDGNLEKRFRILDGADPQLDVIDAPSIEVLDQEWKEAVKS